MEENPKFGSDQFYQQYTECDLQLDNGFKLEILFYKMFVISYIIYKFV